MIETTCPKCGVQVPIPDAQRNAAKVLLKCTSCEHMFVWKKEEALPVADPPAPAVQAEPEPELIPESEAPVPVAAAPAPVPAPAAAPPAAAKVATAPAAPAVREAPLPPVTGQRWQPPASADFVVVVREWRADKADKAKHLAAKLLMERGVGRLTYEQYRKQFDTLPYVQRKVTGEVHAPLIKLLQEGQAKFETGATPLMVCPYHPNDLKAGHCPECGKPLCALCLREDPTCRDCREKTQQAARKSVDDQRSKVRVVTSAALLGDPAQLKVIGFISVETMCDEHSVFDSLSKAMKGIDNTALDQAKDAAMSKLQLKALQLGATAVADYRLSITHFQSEALGKCFAIIQASGTAVA